MYAEGPPSKVATRDVVDLFDPITESALDFGCGIGLYMKELQAKGINCRGIELDRPDIRNNIPEDQKEHITLYDGKFPLPFHDKEFEVSICSEVLEHIPNYKEALAELSRVTRKCVIITVPDIGVVDFLSRNFIIPFHMLEPTHLNFFNEFSLLETVEPYFSGRKELYKICPVVTNGLTWFSSLALIAYQE
jgi:ubiquinone/menaquinone biosynthesis C-methylase UbiE